MFILIVISELLKLVFLSSKHDLLGAKHTTKNKNSLYVYIGKANYHSAIDNGKIYTRNKLLKIS